MTAAVARSAGLPRPLTPLIGRERDVARAVAALRADHARLVTLTGPGGTGKTRVAIQVATETLNDFHDGGRFVSLAPVRDPDLVIPAIAQTLGVRETADQPLLVSLTTALRDRRLLLVLDNVEQVVDGAPRLSELLESCPDLSILLTSRIPLNLYGERVIDVPPLAIPDTAELPSIDVLAENPSVRLFVCRAQAALASFTLTPNNARAVAEICARLDGLPLAIELAAARVSVLSPQMLVERLESCLPLLVGGPRDVPARQQTLHATIAWSYDLLPAPCQALFRSLSVFRGGWTLAAAEAVASEHESIDALDGLQQLVAHNLVRFREEPDGAGRYSMLETIREFALEHLIATHEVERVSRRHAEWCWQLAIDAAPRLDGRDAVGWLAVLDREHANLRAAIAWFREHDEVERGLQLVGDLAAYWQTRGQYRDGRSQIESMLALPGAEARSSGRATAASALCGIALSQGDVRTALRAGQDALAIWRELGERQQIPGALVLQGMALAFAGDTARADATWDEAAQLAREAGDLFSLARALSNLGSTARLNHQDDEAWRRYNESLDAATRAGSAQVMALALNNLGKLELDRGNVAEAERRFHAALELDHASGTTWKIAQDLDGFGAVALERGALVRATCLMGAANAVRQSMGIPLQPLFRDEHEQRLVDLRTRLGDAAFETAWSAGAAMSLEEAIAAARETTAVARSAMPPSDLAALTAREVEVLRLIAGGRSNKEIATTLYLSIRTVERHINNLYRKIDAQNKADATAWALRHHLA